ncbi:uncharacterized protein CANTADRAFT_52044, partial [Suhomyces tanzawaensis NRRL Y-17324]
TTMSAESITKFLRSKGSLAEILARANSLLDGQTSVFLPNKSGFVLELLCDRANDSLAFKSWKLHPDYWRLFSKSWTAAASSPTRSKMFKRAKLVDAVVAVINASQDLQLWTAMFDFIALVKHEHYIDIEEAAATSLLKHYLQAVNGAQFPGEFVSRWSVLINELYQLPNLSINHTVTKKSYSRFIQECVPGLLRFITASSHDLASKDLFTATLIQGLFLPEMIGHLKANVDQLLKDASLLLEEKQISELFEMCVDNLSSKDLGICEDLFISITSTEKFRGLSPALLERLTRVNKSLSSEFFQKIYTSEFDDKLAASTAIDWTLIIYLLDLDIELTIKYAHQVISHASSACDQQLQLRIGKSILHSYLKGRELSQFYSTVWTSAIEVSSQWKDPAFISLVAATVDDFSASQLAKLVAELFQSYSSKPELLVPLMTSISKGLITCAKSKAEAVKDLFVENKAFISTNKEEFWELRYYLSCLYDSSLISDNLEGKSIYYYYCTFRLVELGAKNSKLDSIMANFVKLIKKEPSYIPFVLNRWIIIIEQFFTPELLSQFAELIFANLSLDSLREYLQQAEILYEQKKLASTVIKHLNTLVEKDSSLIELIQLIPIQCYDRSLKKSTMELLYKIAISTKDSECNIISRKAILHLLKSPSFKSKLEMDFKSGLKLLESSVSESKPSSFEIIKLIWVYHLQQINVQEHETYINDSLSKLDKDLSKFSPKKNKESLVLQAAFVIISSLDMDTISNESLKTTLKNLISKFYSSVKEAIVHRVSEPKIDKESIQWLLSTLLIPKSEIENSAILSLVKQVGTKVEKMDDAPEIKHSLFRLICKVSTPKDSLYILSLFFTLYTPKTEITEDLEKYLGTLNEQELEYAFDFVSHSFYLEPGHQEFIPILCCFIRSTKKEYIFTHKMLSQVLSKFLSNFDSMSYESHALILTTLKTSLSDMTWLFNQYGIESLVTLMAKYGALLSVNSFTEPQTVELYIQTTQVMSHVLLFHRYKLSSRHHIIINSFVALLMPLSAKTDNYLNTNTEAASAYSRLLSNLCEPSVTTMSREQLRHSLNSSTALAKRALRKHVPLLLINYIYLALKYNFKSVVNEEIIGGIYNIFDVVSTNELQLVNSSLDIPGKAFFRTLHGNYKDFGKWKDQ